MGGVASFTDMLKDPPWLAGREIGTAAGVEITPGSLPGTAAGVVTPAGFVHQSGGASPQSSSGAEDYIERTITFSPYLAKLDLEHVNALRHVQRQGLPSLWLPLPRVESWAIRATVRNTWSLAQLISGDLGARLLHIVPKVEIRDASGVVTSTTVQADHPSATELTIVPGAPATDTEVQIPSDPDVAELVTGDLTADAGGSLLVHYYGLVIIEIVNVSRELRGLNDLVDELEIIERPRQIDYEADS